MQRMLVFLTVIMWLAGAAAARQQRDTPARQATGKVHEQVVAAETGRPVAHAVISAARTDAPPGRLTDRVVADEQGLFAFEALASGGGTIRRRCFVAGPARRLRGARFKI